MSMTEKPFACTEDNCNMKFTNEDHLNSHQKKHTMSFNLEFCAKSNETAIMVSDETPTPTSFFRNCEEVGLFQDLQNVNPFEETFKKALENCENGASKQNSLITSEDTLHTPHIFPVTDEASDKSVVSDNNELSIMNFVEIPQISDKIEIIAGIDSNIKVKEKQENFRHKLKEALLRRDKKKELPNVLGTDGVIYVNNKDINAHAIISTCVASDTKKAFVKITTSPSEKSSIEKVREMNRAAQVRCRDKKKRYYDRITKELANLKSENAQLRKENVHLRQHNSKLLKIILELGGTKESHTDVLDLKSVNDITTSEVSPKKLPVLAPAVQIDKISSALQPVIYNLVPVQVLNVASSSEATMTALPKIVQEVKSSKSLPRILKRT